MSLDPNAYGTVAGVAAYVKRLTNAAGAFSDGTASSLTTALSGANNDLTFTAQQINADADEITIRYVNPGALSALSVAVADRAITVTLAHDGVGITSTAAQIEAAIEAYPAAVALVSVANAPGSDGSGIVTALTATHLAGGVTATAPTLTEVEDFLNQCSDTLNGWLAAAGYVIPVSQADAVRVLARLAQIGAAGHVELSQRAGGYDADDENRRENKFLDMFERQAQTYINSGALGALGAAVIADSAPPPLAGLVVGGGTRGGLPLKPMFTRTMFGNKPTAENRGKEPDYTDG